MLYLPVYPPRPADGGVAFLTYLVMKVSHHTVPTHIRVGVSVFRKAFQRENAARTAQSRAHLRVGPVFF